MKMRIVNYLLFISFIFLSSTYSHAQSHTLAFSATGGVVQDGFGGLITIDYKTNEFDFVQVNFQGNFINLDIQDIEVPVDLYALNAGYFFDVIRNNSRVLGLSVGGGGTVGYETINKGEEVLENNRRLNIDPSTLVYGFYAGVDFDIFLIPTIAINVRANQTYHLNSELGEFTPYIGLGIKLILK